MIDLQIDPTHQQKLADAVARTERDLDDETRSSPRGDSAAGPAERAEDRESPEDRRRT